MQYQLNQVYANNQMQARMVVEENFYMGQAAYVLEVAVKVTRGKNKGTYKAWESDCAFLNMEGAQQFMHTYKVA